MFDGCSIVVATGQSKGQGQEQNLACLNIDYIESYRRKEVKN